VCGPGHSQGWQLEPPTVSRAAAGGLYASSSSSVTSGKSTFLTLSRLTDSVELYRHD